MGRGGVRCGSRRSERWAGAPAGASPTHTCSTQAQGPGTHDLPVHHLSMALWAAGVCVSPCACTIPGLVFRHSSCGLHIAHLSTLHNSSSRLYANRKFAHALTPRTKTARAARRPSASREMSSATSPPKPPPCKETICSTKKDAFKSMLAAQGSKPGPSAPAAPCPPDREELGRHTWTLVRVCATPAHPRSHTLARHPCLTRCTRWLRIFPRSPPPPRARQPPPSYTCWVGSTRAATALRTSGPP